MCRFTVDSSHIQTKNSIALHYRFVYQLFASINAAAIYCHNDNYCYYQCQIVKWLRSGYR